MYLFSVNQTRQAECGTDRKDDNNNNNILLQGFFVPTHIILIHTCKFEACLHGKL